MNKWYVSITVLLVCIASGVYARPKTVDEQIYSLMSKGKKYFEKQEFDASEKMYKKVLTLDSEYADAYNNLVLIYSQKGDYNKALGYAEKALHLKADEPEYLANQGLVYLKLKQYEEAERVLRRAVEKDNDLYFGFARLAEVTKDQGKYGLSLDYAQRASDLNRDSYIPYKIAAEVYTDQKKYEEAIESYQKAQTNAPDNAPLFIACGKICLEIGRKKAAKKQFRKALKINKKDFDLRMKLAKIYKNDGDYDDAAQEFIYVYTKTDNTELKAEAAYGAALSFFSDKEYDDAEEYAGKAVAIDPANDKFKELMSDILESKGQFKEAAELMPVTEGEYDPNKYMVLGIKHEKAGDFEKAAEYFQKGLAADPGNTEFYFKLGVVFTKAEQEKPEEERNYERAKNIYSEALTRDPGLEKIAYNLAKLFQRESNHQEALTYYWQAIKGNVFYIKAYFGFLGAYVGSKPWKSPLQVGIGLTITAIVAILYIIRRRKIKERLVAQVAERENQ